jgi:hypothetical protein
MSCLYKAIVTGSLCYSFVEDTKELHFATFHSKLVRSSFGWHLRQSVVVYTICAAFMTHMHMVVPRTQTECIFHAQPELQSCRVAAGSDRSLVTTVGLIS